MNSGCFGTEFKDKLISLQCIDTKGNIKVIPSWYLVIALIGPSSKQQKPLFQLFGSFKFVEIFPRNNPTLVAKNIFFSALKLVCKISIPFISSIAIGKFR